MHYQRYQQNCMLDNRVRCYRISPSNNSAKANETARTKMELERCPKFAEHQGDSTKPVKG